MSTEVLCAAPLQVVGLWSLDGNWKVVHVQSAKVHIEPFNGKLQYVSSCPKEPVPKMTFCWEHCEVAEKQNIPYMQVFQL